MKAEAEITTGASALTSSAARDLLRDLCELTKPRLSLLVLVSTLVGFLMAADGPLNIPLLIHTVLGTALVAAGANTLNQLIERRHDALMQRTRERPLPAGRIGGRDVAAFGFACSLVGVLYLALAVNLLTAALGLATVLTYLCIYTPLKRVTAFCTVVGAVPGALPIMMGWTGQANSLSGPAWILFCIVFFWQIPHFMAIAVLYLEDYARAGFPMLPVVEYKPQRDAPHLLPRGSATGRQAIIWSLALIPVTLMPAMLGIAGGAYALVAVALGVGYVATAVGMAIFRSRASARVLFFASIVYLPLLLACLGLSKIDAA